MDLVPDWLDGIDRRVTRWMARHGPTLLRWSLGIVFLWFGALKFAPGASPAEDLATRTLRWLTFGHVPPGVALAVLAGWECLIGLGLLLDRGLRTTLALLWLQLLGTLLPLFLFPHETFEHVPWAPTLEGQYIVKNLVLASAGLVIGATVRGGALVAEPKRR